VSSIAAPSSNAPEISTKRVSTGAVYNCAYNRPVTFQWDPEKAKANHAF